MLSSTQSVESSTLSHDSETGLYWLPFLPVERTAPGLSGLETSSVYPALIYFRSYTFSGTKHANFLADGNR
jgi:hypothetical protein